ncbi:MFS general substrate transporter [Polyporus arcularius HHB13444]|uniref:MFS general substrate transporter n=1 Tax=Polyporus arcularius HHB13444 TaxID=1314778 RepID=A0A5C3P001_9APHY|nr:MFS general substrate transporter [Polyporus arcularius HHB13444]
MRRRGWIQFAALCLAIYVAGWNDGTLGPLLPRLQEVYHVGYAVVSLIFVTNFVGFFLGASTYLYVTDRFGYGSVTSFILAIGNSLQASGAPFPVFVIAHIFAGYGESFLDAGSNAFLASLSENTSTKMGIMHAIYGVGAMCAPLVSTQFARLPRWSFVYLVHIGLVTLNAISQMVTFRFRRQDDILAEIGQPPPQKTKESEAGVNKYKQVFGLRAVHLMAFFIFTYVGVEVTIGGWIVTYVINERHGGANSGYISSGFWGGLTLGRVALLWFNKKIGEWRVIFIYVVLVLGLELVVWLVDSLLPSAICVAFVGFFLGPIYPIVMNHAGTIIQEELISGSIGWISSFGGAGAAAFPFITGAIASGTGIGSLQPLLISMMGLMLVIWAFVPRNRVQMK